MISISSIFQLLIQRPTLLNFYATTTKFEEPQIYEDNKTFFNPLNLESGSQIPRPRLAKPVKVVRVAEPHEWSRISSLYWG
jgi:hypothetical protein